MEWQKALSVNVSYQYFDLEKNVRYVLKEEELTVIQINLNPNPFSSSVRKNENHIEI